jgi:2-amino-4-hydroxy-6-hydroxymethyldihydropteridine diphosphokinase
MIATIALGSNQGDRLEYLESALKAISQLPEISLLRKSKVYQTVAEGGATEQPFLNAVIEVETSVKPLKLLRQMQRIETDNHRIRNKRWGDRTLDIDLIAIDDLVIESEDLKIPHPLAHERSFVLIPWLEVNPEAVLPNKGPINVIIKEKNFNALEVFAEIGG